MIVIKPDVVQHSDSKGNRHPIYSIDFFGNRLATGGGDCKVRLWNTISLTESAEASEQSLLTTLAHHTGSVNIVRWSKDGKYLASGSDDKYILIYRYTTSTQNRDNFGSQSAVKNKENWLRCITLQGHTMDVLDLDWSSNGFLASGSIDNKVLIWDCAQRESAQSPSSSILQPFRVLTGHTSFVKGLSFDPVGHYLATCAEDNVVIIWDCETWSESKRLDDPLKKSTSKAMFKRMSWAPDGGSLCCTSASKSSKLISCALRRGTWESVADFVGHSADSCCSRFLPHVLIDPKKVFKSAKPLLGAENDIGRNRNLCSDGDSEGEGAEKIVISLINNGDDGTNVVDQSITVVASVDVTANINNPISQIPPASETSSERCQDKKGVRGSGSGIEDARSAVCCLAIGDLLGMISVWSTSTRRPLVVIKDLFTTSVSDLAWAKVSVPSSLSRHADSISASGGGAGGRSGSGGSAGAGGSSGSDGGGNSDSNSSNSSKSISTAGTKVGLTPVELPTLHPQVHTHRDILCCSSCDGSVALIDFGQLLGRELTGAALDKHFTRVHGRTMREFGAAAVPLVEDPVALKYKQNNFGHVYGAGVGVNYGEGAQSGGVLGDAPVRVGINSSGTTLNSSSTNAVRSTTATSTARSEPGSTFSSISHEQTAPSSSIVEMLTVSDSSASSSSVISETPPHRSHGTGFSSLTAQHPGLLSPEQVLAMQVKTKTKDGKKRIVPVLVESSNEEADAPDLGGGLLPPPPLPLASVNISSSSLTGIQHQVQLGQSDAQPAQKKLRFEGSADPRSSSSSSGSTYGDTSSSSSGATYGHSLDSTNRLNFMQSNSSGTSVGFGQPSTGGNSSAGGGPIIMPVFPSNGGVRSYGVGINAVGDSGQVRDSQRYEEAAAGGAAGSILQISFKRDEIVCAVPLKLAPKPATSSSSSTDNSSRGSRSNSSSSSSSSASGRGGSGSGGSQVDSDSVDAIEVIVKQVDTAAINSSPSSRLSSEFTHSAAHSAAGRAAERLYLSAHRLRRPAAYDSIRSQVGSNICVITLRADSAFSTANSGGGNSGGGNSGSSGAVGGLGAGYTRGAPGVGVRAGSDESVSASSVAGIWEAAVPGIVTSICGIRVQTPTTLQNRAEADFSTSTGPGNLNRKVGAVVTGFGLGLGLGHVGSSIAPTDGIFDGFGHVHGEGVRKHSTQGLCIVGCADGSLHILSLACGMKVTPPLVLGAPVAFVDAVAVSVTGAVAFQSDSRSSHALSHSHSHSYSHSHSGSGSGGGGGGGIVGAEGSEQTSLGSLSESWGALIHPPTSTPALGSRARTANPDTRSLAVLSSTGARYSDHGIEPAPPNNSTVRVLAFTVEGEVWVWEVVDQRLKCVVKTSVAPVLTSMRCRASPDSSSSVSQLSSSVSRKRTGDDSNRNSNSNSNSNVNGNSRSLDSMLDIQVDSCSLSNDGLPAVVVRSKGAEGGDWQAFSFCVDAMAWVRVVDLRHSLSRLFSAESITNKQQEGTGVSSSSSSFSSSSLARMQTLAATGGGFDLHTVLSVARVNARLAADDRVLSAHSQWNRMLTLSHVEERLLVAMALNKDKDAKGWLSEWVFFCCKNGFPARVEWLVDHLLSLARQQANKSTSTHKSTPTHYSTLHTLTQLVLPAIGASSCCQSLLVDAEDAVGNLLNTTSFR